MARGDDRLVPALVRSVHLLPVLRRVLLGAHQRLLALRPEGAVLLRAGLGRRAEVLLALRAERVKVAAVRGLAVANLRLVPLLHEG